MPKLGERDVIDTYVGSRISLRRSAAGLSQTALAEQLGVSFQQVQKYETGINRISASRLHRVATILGTTVESFFPSAAIANAGEGAIIQDLIATADGRSVALDFPLIERPEVRKALAKVIGVLAQRSEVDPQIQA